MFIIVKTSAGFSIIEVMVVVMIIALLTTLAGNRVLAMIARARQAEARTNLSQIHQLQGTFQLHADNYAAWPLDGDSAIGYVGTATRNCTIGACASTAAPGCDGSSGDGAHKLGWKPKGCSEMRYGYAVKVESQSGKERFLAIAYGSSNEIARIFPTCSGKKNTNTINHPLSSSYTTLTQSNSSALLEGAANEGDLMGITDEKEWVHEDIITDCE